MKITNDGQHAQAIRTTETLVSLLPGATLEIDDKKILWSDELREHYESVGVVINKKVRAEKADKELAA